MNCRICDYSVHREETSQICPMLPSRVSFFSYEIFAFVSSFPPDELYEIDRVEVKQFKTLTVLY